MSINSASGSPLFPFSNSGSSMFAFFKRRRRRVTSRTKVMSSFGRAESAAAEEMAAQAQRGNAGGTRRAPAQGLLAELPVAVVASVEHTGCSSTRREGLGGVDCAEYN